MASCVGERHLTVTGNVLPLSPLLTYSYVDGVDWLFCIKNMSSLFPFLIYCFNFFFFSFFPPGKSCRFLNLTRMSFRKMVSRSCNMTSFFRVQRDCLFKRKKKKPAVFGISPFFGFYPLTLKKYLIMSGVAIFYLILWWILATLGFQHVVLKISWEIEGWTVYSVLERWCALSHIALWVVRDYRTFVIGFLFFWASDFRTQQLNIISVMLENKTFS